MSRLSGDEVQHYVFELKRARNERDTAALVKALGTPHEAPRAMRFLAQIGAAEAAPEIEQLLKAREPHIRSAAADALGKLKAEVAATGVEKVALKDPVQWVRSYALVALAQIRGQRARPVIRKALSEDPDWRTRRAAAVALGLVGTRQDTDFLRDMARREPFLRRRRYRQARWKIWRRARRQG